jgi:hypothetical protein
MSIKHPSASRWAKWPQPPDVDGASPAFLEHIKEWAAERAPLAVYRPGLDDRQTPTISGCRKIYRDSQICSMRLTARCYS